MKLRISELCNNKGITQKELASHLGVHEITISRALKGNTSLELLERIAGFFDVDISELFDTHKENVFVCPKCGTRYKIVPIED